MTKHRLLPLLAVLAVVGIVVAGCGGGGSNKVSSGSIAKVGKVDIKRTQFTALLDQAQRSYKSQKRPFPTAGSSEYIALQNQAVQFLVQRAEFQAKSVDLGIKISDKSIDTRLVDIKKQYFGGDDKKYTKQLKDQGLSEEQVRADIQAQIVSEEIFKKVTADVKVGDADVKAYYLKNPTTYTQAESRDVRHILLSPKAVTDPKVLADPKAKAAAEAKALAAAKALADVVYTKVTALSAKGDWTALAKQYSDDPGSKASGGKLTITRGQTVPEFDKLSFDLKTGAIGKPVKTQFGYHVIQALSAVKPKTVQKLAQVQETIRQQLLQQKRSEAMTAWVEGVKKEFEKKVAYATGFVPPVPPATTTG